MCSRTLIRYRLSYYVMLPDIVCGQFEVNDLCSFVSRCLKKKLSVLSIIKIAPVIELMRPSKGTFLPDR